MSITSAISKAMLKRHERGHEYLYWCIDIHGVILVPDYKLHSNDANYYEVGIETLKELSVNPMHKIILWSSTHETPVKKVLEYLKSRYVRVDYVNCNPECPSTELCDFTKKFYFDILLDDKAGFEPNEDWEMISYYLKNYGK